MFSCYFDIVVIIVYLPNFSFIKKIGLVTFPDGSTGYYDRFGNTFTYGGQTVSFGRAGQSQTQSQSSFFGTGGSPFLGLGLNRINADDYESDSPSTTTKPPKQNHQNDATKPPKQSYQQHDSMKPYKNSMESMDNQMPSPNFENQYVPYQYQFANPNIPIATLVGAAISPAIIPFGYYQIPTSSSSTSSKPSKKKSSSSNRQGASSSKKPSSSSLPEAVRQVTPHGTVQTATPIPPAFIQSPNMQYISNGKQHPTVKPSIKEKPSKIVYSPNQIPSMDQQAYFNYLNTYTPNNQYNPNQPQFNNGVNNFPQRFIQPNEQFNQFNSFNSPFSGSQNGLTSQSNPNFNITLQPGQMIFNPFANQYPPFNGLNPGPAFNGNVPQQFFINPSNPDENTNSFAVYENVDDSDEVVPTMRKPRI